MSPLRRSLTFTDVATIKKAVRKRANSNLKQLKFDSVLVVSAAVAVVFHDVEDLEDEVPGQAFVVGHVPVLCCWSTGG